MAEYTPMIQQYLSIKAKYEDAFLFFRLGDFYELFFDDALKASQELEITLTSRDGGKGNRIPMCGVPHHSSQNYIVQLIEKGFKVAVCEQVEDPKVAKGVVKRDVVQVITPGTVMEGALLDEKANNFIASVTPFEDGYGVATSDLSTGQNAVKFLQEDWKAVCLELQSISAKEIIVPSNIAEDELKLLKDVYQFTVSFEDDNEVPEHLHSITSKLQSEELQHTANQLIAYLVRTQKRSLDHLQKFQYVETTAYMKIDPNSKRNLELVETLRQKQKKGSLLWLLDKTVTAMGGRMLKQWIEHPLLDRKAIEERLSIVETFMKQFFNREQIREQLTEVYDLERLAGKVAYGNVNARDLIQLKRSLQKIPSLKDALLDMDYPSLVERSENMDPCMELAELLECAIHEEAPLSIKEGNIIKNGYHDGLDEYRDASVNGKAWIASLEQSEREKTGIKSLKIRYNRVFGYYIEVTKSNLHLIDEERYERKQTLANAERFITPELKEKEDIILEAEEKSIELEYDLFINIREEVKTFIPQLQVLAKQISEIDVLQSFAVVSEDGQYCKPRIVEDGTIHIEAGRHPVVEQMMDRQDYVSNNVHMDHEREVLLITGPNMAGKSTYMRQVALSSVLLQVGCFVPAESATLPIFDQIFTRIGAADDLAGGQSTFMVEMMETQYALTHATDRSLLLLDEIGRGTSTYDGMSLAQSIIEYIHENIGAKTLFSTHYHELTVLEDHLERLQNIHVKAIEENGKVVFLHRVENGKADRSYGIHVAELAQLPAELIKRANELLTDFESSKNAKNNADKPVKEDEGQLSFFEPYSESKRKIRKSSEQLHPALEKLKGLELLAMTPLEAMNTLYELQMSIKKERQEGSKWVKSNS
ncbi:DNA mismatch repair protein MutS [Pseudalkalibacillus salsuginis]|uniref:DNA mismatch repair protein MutS n=1 Tax=Pseudalkalibacillus salsuginis TaxID=2910972 RepID=UPI001F366B4A|nr:DNA mismatch repair protein MutS [Pseudalkalibacillus salsuginis]MCF6410658.1 DNA mismatch repair protein MutS [Pseudalkalibacillus salsuginis]